MRAAVGLFRPGVCTSERLGLFLYVVPVDMKSEEFEEDLGNCLHRCMVE